MRKKRKLTKKQKETLELIVSIAVLVGFIALNLILGKDIFYVWYFAVIIMFAFEIAFSVYYIFTGKALFFKDEKKKKELEEELVESDAKFRRRKFGNIT